MGINTPSAGSSKFSRCCGGYKVRDPNISARNQRRIDKKKKKTPSWEGETLVYMTNEGIKTID